MSILLEEWRAWVESLELPARYGRLQMSEEEMELVEMGGAA